MTIATVERPSVGTIGVSAAAKLGEVAPSTIRKWAASDRLFAERAPGGKLFLDPLDVRAVAAPRLLERHPDRACELYAAEVRRRGGETRIVGKYGVEKLEITSTAGDLVVLHAEGWRQYSADFGARRATLSYLCGREDGQLWAVRIPGTIAWVSEALAWVTPADVSAARASGRKVLRQGDIYAVETTRPHDGKGVSDLPERHVWDPEARTLSHPQHRTLRLPYPVRFVRQRVYEMGRGAGRAYGD